MYREKERRLCSHSITGLKRAFATMLMVAEIMTATPQFGYASTRGVGDMGNTTMQKPEVGAQIFTPQGQKKYELEKSAEMHENAFKILKTLHNENATDKEKKGAAEALKKMVDFGGSAKFVGDLYTKGLISKETKKEFEDVLNRIGESTGSLIKDGKLIAFEDIRNDESLKQDKKLPKAMRDLIVFSYLVAAMSVESYYNENNALPHDLSIKYKLTSWKKEDEKLIEQAQEMYHKIRESYINGNDVSSSKDVFGPQSTTGGSVGIPFFLNKPDVFDVNVDVPNGNINDPTGANYLKENGVKIDKNTGEYSASEIFNNQGAFAGFIEAANPGILSKDKANDMFNKIKREVIVNGKSPEEVLRDLGITDSKSITDTTKDIFKTYAETAKKIREAVKNAGVNIQNELLLSEISAKLKILDFNNNSEVIAGIDISHIKGENAGNLAGTGTITFRFWPNERNAIEASIYATQQGWPGNTGFGASLDYTNIGGRGLRFLGANVWSDKSKITSELVGGLKYRLLGDKLYLSIKGMGGRTDILDMEDFVSKQFGINDKEFSDFLDKNIGNKGVWKFSGTAGLEYILNKNVSIFFGPTLKGVYNDDKFECVPGFDFSFGFRFNRFNDLELRMGVTYFPGEGK